MDAQSEAAPSTATGSPQPTGTIANIGTISGSNNPTIVGSSGVNINYNFPLEGPGVPAFRPQKSQRPDQEPKGVPAPTPQHSQTPAQEPRPRAPSYQEAGNKTRHILKRVYTTTGSYVQLLPGVDNDQMHISGIYTKVQLETREGVAVAAGKKGESVNSTEYAKIFRLRKTTGELIERLIFFGIGGVGKSTIFDTIAYDWAEGTGENQFLKRFNLVFLLKMCALLQESDLVDSIFDQLLGEKSGIKKDELDRFILANPNEVLILLDGFDEMKTKTLNADSFGSILKALNRTTYQECCICVSSRPSHLETLMSGILVQNPCTHVEVLGFTDEDVHEYVNKFFVENPDSGNALLETIGKSNTQRGLAANPLLLLLMCLLWRESKQLPKTTSRLFKEAVDHMFTKKHLSGEDALKTVITTGQTALRGLMSANQKFSFQEDEFEPRALDLALKAGILTKQRVIKNRKSHNNIQFTHKTMQEYCAAKYLQSVHRTNLGFVKRRVYKVVPFGEFTNNLGQLCQTIEGAVSNEFLFRFCCGDNEKCMTDIVNLLDSKFNKYEPKYQSDVVQAISRNCFLESQSSKAPLCLTSDTHIPSNIDVDNNNDFRSLVYLLEIICRSESRVAQLTRIETIKVSSLSFVSDLASSLRYMENLRALRLRGCPLVRGDLEITLSSLKNNQVTDLCINGDETLGSRAIEWAPHIKNLTSLTKLEISNCSLQTTDIEHIASSVSDMPRLSDLILTDNPALGVATEKWSRYLLRVNQTHTLDLSNCSLTWKDVGTISVVCNIPALTINLNLAGNTALGGSADSGANHLSPFTNINTLNLSNCTLQWTDIEHIASAVGDMPTLTHLILTDNPALGLSTEKLSRYLLRVKQKHTLDLSNFSLTWGDVRRISIVLDHIPTLTHVILAGNKELGGISGMWARHFSRFTNIQTLNLSDCSLQWTDIEHIALAVSHMPSPTDLILSDNPALGVSTEKWSRYLFRVKQKHTLDLSNFSLTSKDVGSVSVLFDHIPTLNLILAGNTALGRSAETWANHLSQLTNIQTLNLSSCTLQYTDILHIASAVGDIPTLTNLILAGNTALGGSAETWANHLSRIANIKTLNLSDCTLQWTDIEHIALFNDKRSLTNLNLAGNTALGKSAEMWANHLLRLRNIETLNLRSCSLQWIDIKLIALFSDKCSLTNLNLAGNTALGKSAEKWANYLSRLTNIKTMNLSNCALQWTDIEHIASAVGDMRSLTDLILSDNPALGVSTKKLSRYLKRVKQKHTLDLSNFSLTWEDVGTISVVLGHIPALNNLNLAYNWGLGGSAELWAKELPRMTHLNKLDLTRCNLTPSDIKHIASAVLDMPRLTDLTLEDSDELGGSAKSWAKELPNMTHLNKLDLTGCDLTPSDIKHIASAVLDMPRLTNLILAFNPALGETAELWAKEFPRMTHLNKLDLSSCDLTPSDIKHIASAVLDMPELTELILGKNPELGGSAESWAKELPNMTHLNKLDLSSCGLSPSDIKHIASAVLDMPELTELILGKNHELGGSAESWAKELPNMKHLNKLDLSYCGLWPSDIKHIASAVLDMPGLTELILGKNHELGGSAESWAKELPNMTHLNKLDLSCDLSPSDIKHIASAVLDMPRLSRLILSGNWGFDSLDDDN